MSETTQQLAQYGITVEEARSFVYSNLNSPQTIYQVAAQYNVNFAMLADIYGQGVSQNDVKGFFQAKGMVANQAAPVWDEDYKNGDYDTMYGRPELDIDEVLGLTEEQIANSDWNTVINQYISALNSYNWTEWGGVASALENIDWESWMQQTNHLAASSATDGSWLTQLSPIVEQWTGFDLESIFDYSDASNGHTGDRFDEYANDFELANSDYKAYVERLFAELGLSSDEMLDFYASLFGQFDQEDMLDQIDQFEANVTELIEQIDNLYSSMGATAPEQHIAEQQTVELIGAYYVDEVA